MSDNGSETSDKMRFSKPSILRLARKAGVKCIAENCYELIDTMIYMRLQEIIEDGLTVKNSRGGKVLTQDDIRESLILKGVHVPPAHNLSTDKIDISM